MQDFMRLYSGLVERCFNSCANDFTSKTLTNNEVCPFFSRLSLSCLPLLCRPSHKEGETCFRRRGLETGFMRRGSLVLWVRKKLMGGVFGTRWVITLSFTYCFIQSTLCQLDCYHDPPTIRINQDSTVPQSQSLPCDLKLGSALFPFSPNHFARKSVELPPWACPISPHLSSPTFHLTRHSPSAPGSLGWR
jgi:hypothetical protein